MDKGIARLIRVLKEKELTIALAESMTCGLAAHDLCGVMGTSDVFKGGIVCYTPEVKHHLMKVPKTIIDKYSCESQQTTDILAKHLSSLIKADIHAAITGLAAPGGSETKRKPVGTVFFTVYYRKKFHHLKKLYNGTPLQIRKKACLELYSFIIKIVSKR